MRSFLADDPPEPPPFDQDDEHVGLTATSSASAANACSGKQAPDSALAAGERSRSGNIAPGATGDESNGGKGNGSSGNGRAALSGNANNDMGGGGGVFVDEAAAGGAGLLLTSPRHLEPFLVPSSSSGSPLMTTSSNAELVSAGMATTSEGTAGGVVRAGGANGSGSVEAAAIVGASTQFVSAMTEVPPTRYPVGAGGGGGAMGADERLWLVYDGVSAAGKGVISKINAPDPYWLGRAPAGAVCPHQHSMEFCSSFESANLLRAVQVGSSMKKKVELMLRFSIYFRSCCPWCFSFRIGCCLVPAMLLETW